jgi:hypothetical protein
VKGNTNIAKLDNSQVKKIKFDKDHFRGIFSDGRFVDLEESWVAENFSKEFIARVKNEGETRKNRFFYLPPGAPRTNDGSDLINPANPIVKYRQHGEYSCLFSSLASALYYFGLHKSAMHMALLAPNYVSNSYEGLDVWPALLKEMRKCCKKLQPQKIQLLSSYDIFENISEYPRVLQLKDADGNTQHAVTIVGTYIFDANCARALTLTRENLDYCCSTDAIASTFLGVFHGYHFICRSDAHTKETFASLRTKFFE